MPNLDDLLTIKSHRGYNRDSSPARKKELTRRTNLARHWATKALIQLHRADYDDLHEQAKVRADTESGEMPA